MDQTSEKLKLLVADIKVLHSKMLFYQWNANDLFLFELEEIIDELVGHFSMLGDDLVERVLQRGELPPITMKECQLAARITDDKFQRTDVNTMVSVLMNDLTFLYFEFKELETLAGHNLEILTLVDDQTKLIEKNLSWLENAVDYDLFIKNEKSTLREFLT